jgi:hypothetical protein
MKYVAANKTAFKLDEVMKLMKKDFFLAFNLLDTLLLGF